jgi:MoxR-like ATPase
VLIEDVPGIGKTLLAKLAKSVARTLDCPSRRIQSRPTCCRAT